MGRWEGRSSQSFARLRQAKKRPPSRTINEWRPLAGEVREEYHAPRANGRRGRQKIELGGGDAAEERAARPLDAPAGGDGARGKDGKPGLGSGHLPAFYIHAGVVESVCFLSLQKGTSLDERPSIRACGVVVTRLEHPWRGI